MTINLPFLAIWRDSMLSGRKIMTARTKQYGQPGDTFEIFGCTFELVSVNPLSLQEIALSYWYEEGCSSPANFVEAWI